MSVINSVIAEEYERNKRMQAAYQEELEKLPRGSITTKRIHGHDYSYLVFRQGDKVINKYITRKDGALEILQMQLEKRKKIELTLRRLKKEQMEIERYLRIHKNG